MDVPALPVPAHELLSEEADRHQQELQIKPIVPEPQEQVGAEDDGKRAKAERVTVAPRPRQQHVERVREQQLRHQQPGVVIHRPPVPSPVGVNRQVTDCLDVVLRPRSQQDQRPPHARRFHAQQQRGLPHEQHRRRPPHRAREHGVRLETVEERQQHEPRRQRRGQPQHSWDACWFRRALHHKGRTQSRIRPSMRPRPRTSPPPATRKVLF